MFPRQHFSVSVLTHFFVSIQTHISVSAGFIVYFYILVDTDYCVSPNPNTLLQETSMKILSQVILEWILNIRCTSHDSWWCAYHALHCYLPFILITYTPFIHCCCCSCHHYCFVIMSKTSNLDQIHKNERDRFESWKESNLEVMRLREELKTTPNDDHRHTLLQSRLQLLLSKKKEYLDFQIPPTLQSLPMPIPNPEYMEFQIPRTLFS